jgi:hypothetical protein
LLPDESDAATVMLIGVAAGGRTSVKRLSRRTSPGAQGGARPPGVQGGAKPGWGGAGRSPAGESHAAQDRKASIWICLGARK